MVLLVRLLAPLNADVKFVILVPSPKVLKSVVWKCVSLSTPVHVLLLAVPKPVTVPAVTVIVTVGVATYPPTPVFLKVCSKLVTPVISPSPSPQLIVAVTPLPIIGIVTLTPPSELSNVKSKAGV